VPPPRTAHFVFLHRFELVGEESKKVINYPTFTLSLGLPGELGLGATYSSRSELGAGTANEWELGARRRFTVGRAGEVALYAAYNGAAGSADGEIAWRARLARLTLLGAARGFSDAYGEGEAAGALAGGVLLHLTPRLALTGDLARVVTADTLPMVWSAGLHLAIPNTPHTLGFVVSNVGTATLQGASRAVEEQGESNLRYGFAFTMPLGTFAQWGRIFAGDTTDGAGVAIRDFAFAPAEIRVRAGETVRWTNQDGTAHSVTARDGAFDSGLLQPGASFERRFETPGRYPFACVPHPYMTGVVVVAP
jgi:plastocyanin